jgi:hypothetical protein
MAEAPGTSIILESLLRELQSQGQGGRAAIDGELHTAYPVTGTIDVLALAVAVENALGGGSPVDEEAKSPAELNAANDG